MKRALALLTAAIVLLPLVSWEALAQGARDSSKAVEWSMDEIRGIVGRVGAGDTSSPSTAGLTRTRHRSLLRRKKNQWNGRYGP